jgi:hypothetical protein
MLDPPDGPGPAAAARAPCGPRPRRFAKNACQADGCAADLAADSAYCRRNHVCPACLKAPEIGVQGVRSRFCQRCGLSHPLAEFDGSRKSCRAALAKVSARRRRRREPGEPGEAAGTAAASATSPPPAAAAAAEAGGALAPWPPPHLLPPQPEQQLWLPPLPPLPPPPPRHAGMPPPLDLLASAAQVLVAAAADAGGAPVSVPVHLQLPPGLSAADVAALVSGEWTLAPRSALAPGALGIGVGAAHAPPLPLPSEPPLPSLPPLPAPAPPPPPQQQPLPAAWQRQEPLQSPPQSWRLRAPPPPPVPGDDSDWELL